MTWNNRVMRHFVELNGGELTPYFQIHEVYYNEKGKVDGWTEGAIAPRGDTVEELIEHIEQMLRDAKKSKDDVLDYEKGKNDGIV